MVTSGRVAKQMCGFSIYIVELSVNPRRDTLPIEFTTMLRLLETEKTTKSYRALSIISGRYLLDTYVLLNRIRGDQT